MYHSLTTSLPWVDQMNALGESKTPFLFIIDFELEKPMIFPLDQIPDMVYYKVGENKNYHLHGHFFKPLEFEMFPMEFEKYEMAFEGVKNEILFGNSFLLNLTFPTEIKTNYTLRELFNMSYSKYKLYYDDKFIVSSPETFVQIKNGRICTYPMKGTIDATIPNAADIILNDVKETSEHYTIVDLLRNDLSMVAHHVRLKNFRYIDTLQTNAKTLLQVSSEIEGILPDNYYTELGTIFSKLLPAGSVSGAPKKKTCDIIRQYEIEKRGYYTGVFGVFDGENLDSAVMIRYFEKVGEKLFYRSGCGITNMSDCKSEYKEMIDKVYVPISRKH